MQREQTALLRTAASAKKEFAVSDDVFAPLAAELLADGFIRGKTYHGQHNEVVRVFVEGITAKGREALDAPRRARRAAAAKAFWVAFNAVVSALVALAVSRLAGS